MIFCTHQELFRRRPGWREQDEGLRKLCRGNLVVDPDTEDAEIWIADCDQCGETIGIPPRQQATWRDRLPGDPR